MNENKVIKMFMKTDHLFLTHVGYTLNNVFYINTLNKIFNRVFRITNFRGGGLPYL